MRVCLFLTLYFLSSLSLFSQCYEGNWQSSSEVVCLDPESQLFTYIHDSLFGEDDTLQGPYELKGDTLIFQPGVAYDTLPILKISIQQTEDGAGFHYVDILNQDAKPLEEYTFYGNQHVYIKDPKHEPYIKGELPAEIQLDYQSIVSDLLPNPVTPQKQGICFQPPNEEGPFEIKIYLDTRTRLKSIFEGESKALMTEKGLVLLRYDRSKTGLILKAKD